MNLIIPNANQANVPTNRIVLLGASNLTLSLRLLIQLIQQRCGGPSEILVAAGHGRSYGQFSQVMMRGLPGITNSSLWSQFNLSITSATQTSYALVTDIGNDILYGVTPEQLLVWVEDCIERLQQQSVHIVMTNLPIASIEQLSERRFNLFRYLFYPYCRLSRSEVISRANIIHSGLMHLAKHKKIELCEQAPTWFGADGIHLRYWQRKTFYQQIINQFPATNVASTADCRDQRLSSSWQQRPQFAYKTIFGKPCRHPQPSGQLSDNATVSLY